MSFSDMAVALAVLIVVLLNTYVCCEEPSVVKIGAVFTYDSVIGKAAKVGMEMAVYDVNADPTILNGIELKMVMEDSSSCNVFLGTIKALQVMEKDVVAIIGPESSAIARIISHISNWIQVPVLSYAATDPSLSSLQFPYFIRTTQTDSNQMAAVADIIDFYGWKEIIAIFVDNNYGRNGITALSDLLVKKMSKISYKLPLSPKYDLSEIFDILHKSKSFGSRVYVVHIDPDPMLKFFSIVKKLDMIASNYVWIATDWLSSTLDSFPGNIDFPKVLQGVVTLRAHIPDKVEKRAFMSRLRNMQKKDFMNSNFNVYGLYAYDTLWVIARSLDRFLKEHGNMSFSLGDNLQLRNVKVFDGGGLLMDIISKTNFTGLTGKVKFDADNNLMNIDYEIINIVGETTFKVGYWSNDTGLSVQSPESLKRNKLVSTVRGQKLDIITWPGGEVEKPRGWVVATAEKPLRIGVPKRVSFTEFEDFCIDLFDEVRKMVPYEVPFRFEPFGDGLNNPSYDELVRMVADDIFDAAVGDIAIVTNRTKVVDFTQPFVATGLVILAPIENSISSGWVFLKPFTLEMWCVTAASFVIIAVVIWMLEHRVNDDFRGPPRRQMQKMFLFSFSTLFKANHEKVVSTLGRFVMVVWLFILLVITSSYTASLSSILTVQQLSTPITGINSLISSGLPIGFQVGSFAYSYMMNSLDIHRSRLISLGSPEEYESALRRGPTNGGVAAIVDEIPYVELFLSKQSDFGIVGQTFTRSGWGFAFQKGSPLAADMSTAILNLAESGQLEKIHNKWFCKSGSCPEERMRKSEDNRLHLRSFLALYSFCGIFALTALFIFLIRAVRQYIKYTMKQMDPSASSLSMSSNIVFGQSAVRNFLKFFDEKEEAVKKFFAQHGNPTTQAFQKGSPLAADMSTAILNLAESGQLEKIHNKWFCKSGSCPEERMRKSEDNRLHLRSFLALYSFCGIFALTALFIFLIRAVRQYIKYTMKQMDPSASSLSMSSNIVFGQSAVRNFLKFFDEKEEAVKKFFAQHGNPTTQAFQKGSPLAADMSTAILNLAESGQLEKIHNKWFCKSGSCPEERMRKSEDNRLHLRSFLALYSFCGIFALTALFIFLIRAVRQYIKYTMKQMDPSASSLSMSSNIVFGQSAVRNFLKFFDEKEEAVKKFFAQHGNPTTQVSQ